MSAGTTAHLAAIVGLTKATIERAALVALLRRPDVAWSEAAVDIQEGGSTASFLAEAVDRAGARRSSIRLVAESIRTVARDIDGWTAEGIGVHAFFDHTYPAQLLGIRELPPLLFSRGDLRPRDHAVAVVGNRRASAQGLHLTRTAATALAEHGMTVVSGLAEDIDTAAHSAALAVGGRTVAVLGTGIRRHHPVASRHLQDRIAEVGLVVSQFWPDTPPSRQRTHKRNAVMSGYAVATLVIEAGETSDARIQAGLALRHGRPVVLTSQVMQHRWARAFAGNPAVYVAGGTAELLETVEEILRHQPTPAGPADFPHLSLR